MGNNIGNFKNCELTTKFETSGGPYSVYGGFAQDDTEVTVFVYDKDETGSDIIHNSVKYMKTLRHPGVVKLLGLDETEDETWVVTEAVQPLETVIDKLSEEEICAGLYDIIQVLAFVHDKARLCHNNLQPSSIFISDSGAWKLAGLEFTCPFRDASASELSRMSKWRSQKCVAPEEKKGFKANVEFGYARDCYAFGHLAEQYIELISSRVGARAKTFELRIQDECLNPDPEQRPEMSSFLDDVLFKSDFVDILNFLRTLTVHNETEKRDFFRKLPNRLYMLPPNLVACRLSRPLLARFVLLDPAAVEHLLPSLLTPCSGNKRPETFTAGEVNPIFPVPLFQEFVIPEIVKIMHVRDAHIRIVLLRHFHAYYGLFEKQLLKAVILPQVLVGLRDINDELGELSLRALADMVPVLGGSAVISNNRAKLFSQGTPKKVTGQVTANGELRTTQPLQLKSPARVAKQTIKDVAKDAEREQRREAARKRAEERRIKRELRQKNPVKAQIIDDEAPVAKTIESDDGGPVDINKVKADLPQSDTVAEASQSEEASENSNINDMDPDNLDTSMDRTESDIDWEIEKELESMESTLPKEKQHKVVPVTQAEKSADIQIDWSDVSEIQTRTANSKSLNKGVLKLKSPKSKLSPPPAEKSFSEVPSESESNLSSSHDSSTFRNRNKSGEFDDWSGTGWGDMEEKTASPITPTAPVNTSSPRVQDNHNPLNTKTPSAFKVKGERRNKGPPKVQDNLGADFDIKSMDEKNFKGLGTEVDFFADMAPSIKPQSGDLLNLLAQTDTAKPPKKGDKQSEGQGAKTSGLSFAMQDTDGDAEGWGDEDFEW